MDNNCKPEDDMAEHDLDWDSPKVNSDETVQTGICGDCGVEYSDISRLVLRVKSYDETDVKKGDERITFDENGKQSKEH